MFDSFIYYIYERVQADTKEYEKFCKSQSFWNSHIPDRDQYFMALQMNSEIETQREALNASR